MLSAIMRRFSASSTPSAVATWKSQLLPTRQRVVALVAVSAARPGSFAALRPERRVMPKAARRAWESLGGFAKKASSVGFAPGQPPSM